MHPIKIVLIGPSGIGKTTLKKIFFENQSPLELITKSLEPTYGVETSFYNNYGMEIAIHDLAGQQIDDWLHNQRDVFYETNIIICLLDSAEKSDLNYEICKEINAIQKELCPNSYLFIFLHKIDLLSENEIIRVDEIYRRIQKELHLKVYKTSIFENNLVEIFLIFCDIIRNCVRYEDNLNYSKYIDCVRILIMFNKKETYLMDEIKEHFHFSDNYFNELISNLISKDILNSNRNVIELTEKGNNLIKNIPNGPVKSNIPPVILKNINAVILSDRMGRSFFFLENTPHLFKELFPENHESDPSLISMFFCAIRDFGTTIDSNLSNIQIFGKSLQIYSINYALLCGLFFLNSTIINPSINEHLNNFIKQIYTDYQEEIDLLVKIGALQGLNAHEDKINEKIIKLDEKLSDILKPKHEIPKVRYSNLYKKIDNYEISDNAKKTIRELLFNYVVSEDTNLIQEIQLIMSHNNLDFWNII